MLRTDDNRRHVGVALAALLCALTSLFATSHVAFATHDEGAPHVISDLDLQHHLERRQAATGRLYQAVTRREWAGAAAGMMAQRAAQAAEVGERGSAPPTSARRNGAPSAAYGTWDRLAQCEATGDWSANTGNGFYGGLQFTLGTWSYYGQHPTVVAGYVAMPNLASRATQIAVAERVLAGQGPGAWPVCSYKAGLR